MRNWSVLLFFPVVLMCQPEPPAPALVRGVLLEHDPQTAKGEFSVRRDDNHVLRYSFDAKTYVERDSQPIEVSRLEPGEKVEVLSDEGPATSLRYARTVHVLAPAPVTRTLTQGRLRAYRTPVERLLPAAPLSFSGVIFGLSNSQVKVHTRQAGDQTFLLRQDTRYVEDGDLVDAGALKPNLRVFVRAGRTLYDDIEAYQIVWGHILLPSQRGK